LNAVTTFASEKFTVYGRARMHYFFLTDAIVVRRYDVLGATGTLPEYRLWTWEQLENSEAFDDCFGVV
jgi:hypothetical protein